MRPIDRRASPLNIDFENYRDAFPELRFRLGPYCSYCERTLNSMLSVEHIQSRDQHPGLAGAWSNFLLGCFNCNCTKGHKPIDLSALFFPDRDNTFAAFEYTPDGQVLPSESLTPEQRIIAQSTLALTGLDKPPGNEVNADGISVAVDRPRQRAEAWALALSCRNDLEEFPSDVVRRRICDNALDRGFFSIWMKVFESDIQMRRLFIKSFPGTAQDCFTSETQHVSPRPSNNLPHSGKI